MSKSSNCIGPDVAYVKLPKSGDSRSQQRAKQFVKDHPVIWIHHDKISCSLVDDRVWICKSCNQENLGARPVCIECHCPVSRSDAPNDGSRDQGDTPSPYLLVRHLDKSLNEADVCDLLRNAGVSPKRLLFIRDKLQNSEPSGFAFVEFASTSDAAHSINQIKFGSVSHIHLGVFQPATEPNVQFTSVSGVPLRYWDASMFASEYPKESVHVDSVEERVSDEADAKPRKKRKKVDHNLPMQPHIQKWHTRQAELHGSKRPVESTHQQSFADPDRVSCYLCCRKFEEVHELNAHERVSELHIYNLTIPEKIERAKAIYHRLHQILPSSH